MSRPGSFAGFFPAAPSVQNQKRKRSLLDRGKPDGASGSAPSPSDRDTAALQHGSHKRRRVPSDDPDSLPADLEEPTHLNGDPVELAPGAVGSASSASTTSSVFSHGGQGIMSGPNGASSHSYNQTPLTNHASSPSGRAYSPRHQASALDPKHTNGHGSDGATVNERSSTNRDLSYAPNDIHSAARPRARPGPGEVKGEKIAYDPETDPKNRNREQRTKLAARWRQFGQSESGNLPPDPRLAIPGYRDGDLGDFRTQAKVWKRKMRNAPYIIPTYSWDPMISIGSGPPAAVVVTGFDPFTSEAQLRIVFGSYGDIALLENQTDPNTGSLLGICWIRYRDGNPNRGGLLAIDAAKKAEKEGTGQRLGVNTVRVERDRAGKRCKRYVDSVSKRNEERRIKEMRAEEARRAQKTPTPQTMTPQGPGENSAAPPPNAPRGPSGRLPVRLPEGPRAATAKTVAQSLIESDPVVTKIKRKPYLFVPASSVPVMGTTIPHLKKRMKAFDWREVRCDESGYFIIFEESKRGKDEAIRCFHEMQGKPMFTYTLQMERQEDGNPNYERSPSPERALAMKRKKEELERKARDAELDWEEEKKTRVENLDPAAAAVEQLRIELKEKLMGDIKSRIAAPTLFELMEPSRHAAKRQELGIPDPTERPQAPALLLAGDVAVLGRNSHRGYDHRRQMFGARSGKANVNAFVDERRRKVIKRRPEPLSLHHRLLALHGEDSDDEEKASSREDVKGDDSRSISRLSSMAPEGDAAAKNRRRAVEHEDSVRGDESGDDDLGIARKLLDPHILKKEPEDMAIAELQQVLSSLPPTTRLHKHAQKELKIRQRNRDDDRLFLHLKAEDVAPSVEPTVDDIDISGQESVLRDPAALKRKDVKTKKKSKKQLFEEREAAKSAAKSAKALLQEEPAQTPEAHTIEEEQIKEEEDEEEEEERAEVEWGVSTDVPRRTVEDEPGLVMDIDGWQHIVKDDEDFRFLGEALQSLSAAKLGNAGAWALAQKEIKRLNVDGEEPGAGTATIRGHYIPNHTGSARTEGVKKILESEKSKYLPHRLKVAADRARRQAEAANPTFNIEAAKKAKLASTANSRTNRANNRTQMKDINTVKQSLILDGQQGDAIRFNALKKRKKLVKFERSAIHGWGLYADENIALGDMIIEYVGEKVRQAVANIREIRYDKQGMGSSYLFRIDEDAVVDATKKGGIARFINHSCAPNCTAKIIRVDGTKRIVIYALKEITKDEELTYDYKFDRELEDNDRIPCLCGSDVCKGFLN